MSERWTAHFFRFPPSSQSFGEPRVFRRISAQNGLFVLFCREMSFCSTLFVHCEQSACFFQYDVPEEGAVVWFTCCRWPRCYSVLVLASSLAHSLKYCDHRVCLPFKGYQAFIRASAQIGVLLLFLREPLFQKDTCLFTATWAEACTCEILKCTNFACTGGSFVTPASGRLQLVHAPACCGWCMYFYSYVDCARPTASVDEWFFTMFANAACIVAPTLGYPRRTAIVEMNSYCTVLCIFACQHVFSERQSSSQCV